jgi:EmrB/QacA subfamily drug resistance transporter
MNIKQPCDEAVVLSGDQVAPCAKSLERWILIATILGSSMAFIDGTVVNVALPALQQDLNATVADVQWVIEAYSLCLAALLLLGGSLGDRFGRRKIYALGIALFALASVWCGFSPNINQLIVARAAQGIGAALLVPGSLAIISVSFNKESRGKAIGTWSGFTSITAAIGPVIGGWLIENVSWRAAFFINIPVAIVVLLILFWRVPESRNQSESHRLDWPGAALATAGLGAIVYGLIESSNIGLRDIRVLVSTILGILLFFVLVIVERKTRHPMLPLDLFRSRNFSGANLLTLLLYAALSGALFFYPLNAIQIQGYSATAAGASLLPFILIMFLLSRWSGGLIQRYGSRAPLVIGPVIVAVGFALFALAGREANYWTTFFPAVVVLGLGMAISVAPLTTTVMNAVSEQHAGIASGVNNAVSRTAGVLAIALFGIIMLHNFEDALKQKLDPETRSVLLMQKSKLAAIQPPANLPETKQAEVRRAIQDSFVSAFRLVMFVAAGLAVASSISAWVLISSDAD